MPAHSRGFVILQRTPGKDHEWRPVYGITQQFHSYNAALKAMNSMKFDVHDRNNEYMIGGPVRFVTTRYVLEAF